MTTADVLRAARAKIADPSRWTQGTFARDAYGEEAFWSGREAVCWCAVGAICAVAQEMGADEWEPRLTLERTVGLPGDFNDTHSHAEVLAAFDKAIVLAEAS